MRDPPRPRAAHLGNGRSACVNRFVYDELDFIAIRSDLAEALASFTGRPPTTLY